MTQPSHTDLHSLVTLPILSDSIRLAKQLAQQHLQPQQAERTYHNLVAVLAINQYLQMLGFSTDLSQCDCWNPFLRMTMDVADLEVVGYGRIECCPISPAIMTTPSPVCIVPADVEEERVGYIVVRIEGDLTTLEPIVQLVGFTDTVTGEELPLSDLRSLSELPRYLYQLTHPSPVISHLTNWFSQIVEVGWTSVDSLIGQSTPSRYSTRDVGICNDRPQYRYGKTLILKTPEGAHAVALIVEIMKASEVNWVIELAVCPIVDTVSESAFLPLGLEIMIVDQMGSAVMQAQARAENHRIELGIHAETGDRFQLKVQLDDTVVTESFLV